MSKPSGATATEHNGASGCLKELTSTRAMGVEVTCHPANPNRASTACRVLCLAGTPVLSAWPPTVTCPGDRIKQAHVQWAWEPTWQGCGRMEMRRTFPHRLKVERCGYLSLCPGQSTALTGTDCVPSGKTSPSSKELAGPVSRCVGWELSIWGRGHSSPQKR